MYRPSERNSTIVNFGLALFFCAFSVMLAQSASADCVSPRNAIEQENCLPGDGNWQVTGSGDPTIQGFATDMSVNVGQTIYFKVNTDASSYSLEIYRIGYYQGFGGRKVDVVSPSAHLPQVQPACIFDNATSLVDCGNWSISASWQVPVTATPGLYIVHLVRPDTGGESQIPFVVRNDASQSDILYQTSDLTWQAYNNYGGHSLYGASEFDLTTRAYKVSFNRPYNTRSFASNNFIFNAEYPMIRWLEANGYDVSYISGIDTARNGSLLLKHKIFMASGHDEYVDTMQRANIEAARDAGVNLTFFAGNETFWKTRWENSTDGSNTPYRTLVCYKETLGDVVDPLDPPMWTGTWRDPSKSPPADGGRPENALTGTLFKVNGPGPDNTDLSMQVPAADGKMRFWRNTSLATLTASQTATLPPGTLGYEWDVDPENAVRPAGLFHLSTATYTLTTDYLLDYGGTYGAGVATHHMTMYRASSGALVFGAGSVQWSWGLDSNHDGDVDPAPDVDMQQATVNLFADMGVQPVSLQTGLLPAVSSSDTVAPVSTITSPVVGANVNTGSPVVISGTATDSGGGVVAGVEVSADGGQTWHPAIGRENWTYSWTAHVVGTAALMSRAVDDSANLENPLTSNGNPSGGVQVNVVPQVCPCSVWNSLTVPNLVDSGDAGAIEVGVKFRSDNDGVITGLKFYKSTNNTGTHFGHLWTASGTLLATATFTAESSSGWQEVLFATPVPITANTTYVASYFAPAGHYSADLKYFQGTGYDNPPLHALADAVDGPDGVYIYTSTPGTFPTNSYSAANYWVDVVFVSGSTFDISGNISGIGGAGATVNLTGTLSAATTADPSGNYSFSGLVNGPYTVTPSNTGVTFSPSSQTVTINQLSVNNVNFSAAATFPVSISGSITGGGPGTIVYLTGQASLMTVPDSMGNYSFNGLIPGTYFVTPIEAGFIFTPSTQSVTLTTASVSGVNFTSQPCPCTTIWPPTVTPTLVDGGDPKSVEIGVKFRFDVAGHIQALRFYKASTNTGTHVGHIWSRTGTLLGTATFITESASGWQEVVFASPVAVSANTTYLASYFAPAGHYSADSQFFQTAGVDNPPLHALANGFDGPDGIYIYSSTPAFPTNSYGAANYWVDVVFMPSPPHNLSGSIMGAGGPGATVTLTGGSTVSTVADASGNFSFTNVSDGTYVVTPSQPGFAFNIASHAVTLNGADVTGMTFSTLPNCAPCDSIWPTSTTPPVSDAGDPSSVNIGVKFRADTDGFVVGLRFYKSATNTGNHIGTLWASDGTPLGSVVFSGESDFGWQQALFTAPISINAHQTYIVSYLAPTGHYAGSNDFFASSGTDSPPLHALANGVDGLNGVYTYGSTTLFPTQAYRSSNYWVDVLYTPGTTHATSGTISGAGGPNATVTLTGSSSAVVVADSVGNFSFAGLSNGNYWISPSQNGYIFSPGVQPLTINGADVTGVNFSTLAACPCNTIWAPSTTPAYLDSGDGPSVNVGVKFRADNDGYILGVRYYKASANTGTHVGTLWAHDGTPLATATFTAEAQSGWQQVLFSSPVPVQANTTYVASYFAPVGHYSVDPNYFATSGTDNPPLHALATGVDGPNGLYVYAPTTTFPTQSYLPSNYWVDVIYAGTNTYTISGTIAGPGGPGAIVSLAGTSSATTTADASGKYSFSGVANGSYTATPTQSGFTFTPNQQAITINNAHALNVNFSSAVQTFSISGTISGPGGAGATVTLTGASTATTTADGSGNYSFTGLANGSYTVTPSLSGSLFTPASQAVTITGGNATANFTATLLTYTITGTISGPGGAGATVSLTGSSTATTTANGSGNYSFTGLTNGAYNVTPSLAGYVFTPGSQAVTISGAAATANFTSAPQTYTISGTISGPGGAGATVNLTGASTATTTADGLGNYSFTALLNGSYVVTPIKTGYVFTPGSQAVTVSGGNATANFTSALQTYTLSGIISGPGGAGATVNLTGASTATTTADGLGNYSLTGLTNGAYNVTPSLAGYVFTPPSQAVTISGGNATANFTSAPQTYTISGNISGSGGAGATLSLTGSSTATTTADGSGNYSFTGLLNGSYTVTPSNTGYVFLPASQAVTISGGNATAIFTASLQTYTISGNISGPGGAGATVNLAGAFTATTTADGSGNFSFSGLLNGSYAVTPTNTGYVFTAISQIVVVSGTNFTGLSFSTVSGCPTCNTIWAATAAPTTGDSGDTASTELGVKFRADSDGYITGLQFYKASTNTGTHVAHLWTSTGTLLGTATFTTEGISGWQQALFATPIPVVANTTYVASYFAPSGHYSADSNFFATTGVDNPPLHALANGVDGPNGVYLYTAIGGFPTSTLLSTNYWVDVVYNTGHGYSIVGTLTGPGAAGATVSLTGTSTSTTTADASGHYSFSGLANGSYTVTPSNTGYVFTPASQTVTISGAHAMNVNFSSAQQTYSISGTIGGPGAAGATVNLSGASTATTTADGSGNYSFTGLANGSYTVTPSLSGYIYTPATQTVPVSGANVSSVNFTSAPQTYTINGSISGPGGPGATVSLTGASTATTTADGSGNYSFTGLPNGSYTVTPTNSGFVFTPTTQSATISGGNVSAVNFGSLPTVTSVVLSPASVIGGSSSTATVTLSGPAPAGGAVVTLSSSNPAAALVPGSVTVAASATTATFSVTTNPVATTTSLTVSATYGTTQTASFTVTLPVVTSISLSPSSVQGGSSSTGTVTLNGPAPAGGAVVTLSSSNPAAAIVPGSVTVAANATTATFSVTTNPVAAITSLSIAGTYGATQTASFTVTPPVVSSVSLSPASVQGGSSSTGTVTLSGPAPAGGAVVTLSSSNPAVALVSASVTVAASATTATFSVTTNPVATTTSLTVSATYGTTQTASFTVTPPVLTSLSLNPTSVPAGAPAIGTVTLSGPAPAGGAVVTLLSSNATAAQVPASVTVAANATSATFPVTSSSVAVNTTLTISGNYGVTRNASFTVMAGVLGSVTLSPTSVLGGTSSTGTVTLSKPAPAGGAVVTLSSSNTAVALVPASVTVAAGATTTTFTVITSPVAANTPLAISGTYGSTKAATLNVLAAALSSVTLTPGVVIGGTSSTGTVTLNGRAPAGGVVVTLSSSNAAAAQVPASVTVAANATTATFTVTSSPVASNTSSTISGTYISTRTATLTVNAATLNSVIVSPASVLGGISSTGTVTLNGPAPSGGAVVTLSSSNTTAAQVPASVTVAANTTTATFTVTTSPVGANSSVTITGTRGTAHTATLTVTAATLSSVSLSPTSVIGRTSSTGTVTLNGPAPFGGAVVTLSSSNATAAQVPATVTVAANATTATFTVTTNPVATNASVTITGTRGTAHTATLTVTAPTLSALTLNPPTVKGLTPSTGTVTLSGPAPTGGTVVTLSSNLTSVATVPANVTVAAGATSATFTVTTKTVTTTRTVTISATKGGTLTAALTVTP